MSNPLEALGLEVSTGPKMLELAAGVMLTFRPPTSQDASIVASKLAHVFDPARQLMVASERYGLERPDLKAFADPENWEGLGRFFAAVELAALIVTRIERAVGGEALTVEPTVESLSQLLRMADNMERFERTTEKAGSELISPKKEPALSPNGSSAAGARTATGADTAIERVLAADTTKPDNSAPSA